MLLIPAIDLKDGQCVRLKQGRMSDATVFSADPVAMAEHWVQKGCRRMHLVDLDGAFAGQPRNRDLIAAITRAIDPIPVQVGGGIRDRATIEAYFEAGITAVIVGTKAIQDPAFLTEVAQAYPYKVILGLDARAGQVATHGWDTTSDISAVDLAVRAASLPIAAIVYTDIDRDGMLAGVNVEATLDLAAACGVPVIASGGVSDLKDVQALVTACQTRGVSLFGAITGQAIYAGTLDFAAGQALLDQSLQA
ncbi:MAG: 1-(5-phosphoribosyl)-5-[(5-phosphoribosylamino)methylideneamino]imidazole-4-carboxamide isomerase [Proteobacteria bacterium]|nr:1-(5-phosphoribosyl)-5-[(5-phosphoribosylamino)methylideneamino]imidazole-4-carboxamide isomerase [Pseudomonadota bacterium]